MTVYVFETTDPRLADQWKRAAADAGIALTAKPMTPGGEYRFRAEGDGDMLARQIEAARSAFGFDPFRIGEVAR